MNSNVYCQYHNSVFEYLCTNCKSLMCLQCLEKHPKHLVYGRIENSVIHILKYAKQVLYPIYDENTMKITYVVPPLLDRIPETREKLKEMLKYTIEVQGKIQAVCDKFSNFNDGLSRILAKVEYSDNFESEQKLALNEYEDLKNAIRTANIITLAKLCKSSECAPVRPMLEPNDINSAEAAFTVYKKMIEDGNFKIIDQLSSLEKTIDLLEKEIKEAGKPNDKIITFKEFNYKNDLSRETFEESLKEAINNVEINDIYRIFAEMRKSSMSLPKIFNICFKIDGGLHYLLSYALQQKQINPEDQLLPFIQNYLYIAETKKDTETISKFQNLMMKELLEYNLVTDVMKETGVRAQDRKIREFLKIPKGIYTFSKTALDQYLDYKGWQSKFAYSLLKGRPDLARTLSQLESVLKVAHYANQIPSLEPQVSEMSKKLDIPKKHMAIIRLKAYGQAGEWEKFVAFIERESPKLQAEQFAEMCILYKNHDLAKKYIKKIKNVDIQMNMYVEIEAYIDAAETAVSSGKPELIDELKARVLYDMDPYIREAQVKLQSS